jgi:S-formylglutathione hydrolase FrmB
MALIHCNFYSHVLDLAASMTVILPQPKPIKGASHRKANRKHPTLYLLHGLSDDHTIWQRRTSIERYVEGWNLAVVMPDVHRSFYTDMAKGYRYWTFISQELPVIARSLFPLSEARKDNFVAGLSMGGYGAFKLALSYPDRFAAAASLSGVLDIVLDAQDPDLEWQAELKTIFGRVSRLAGSPNDLFRLAKKVADSDGFRPRLYQWCGREDILYPENTSFRKRALELGLDLTYEEGPGEHEWGAWDRQIQRVLEWLPLRRLA